MARDVFGKQVKSAKEILLLPGDVAAYGRKSNKKRDGQQKSLNDQKECCFEIAQEYDLPLREADWFQEEEGHAGDEWWSGGGKSGLEDEASEKARTRPVLTKLMRLVVAGVIKGIIIWSQDRLWRSSAICEQMMDILAKHDCLLYDRYGLVNIATPDGRTAVLSAAVAATHQRESSAVNAPRGVTKSRERGKVVVYSNVLGYRSAGPKSGKVISIPEEQELVRRIFRLFDAGEKGSGPLSAPQIARLLESEGVVLVPDTHHYARRREENKYIIYDNRIRHILRDVRYQGFQRHEKQSWICNQFLVNGETVVPKELFDRVQGKLNSDNRTGNRGKHKAPLAGLIRCGLDGQTLHLHKAKTTDPSVHERAWIIQRNPCWSWCKHTVPQVRERVMDAFVFQTLAPLFIAEIQERSLDSQRNSLESEQRRLQREICEAERFHREEIPQFGGSVTPQTLGRMEREILKKIEALRSQLRSLALSEDTLGEIVPLLSNLEDAPLPARSEALRACIRWIAILPTHSDGRSKTVSKKRGSPPFVAAKVVFLTAWNTYLTGIVYREHLGIVGSPGYSLRLALPEETIGGVSDFPDPEAFLNGLKRTWSANHHQFSSADLAPGYTCQVAMPIAEFDLTEEAE